MTDPVPPDPHIADAILAGIGSSDIALEQMTEILRRLDCLGYEIVARDGREHNDMPREAGA